MIRALILNGATGDDSVLASAESAIIGQLKSGGWDVESVRLKDRKIAGCLGCFGCWLKTPGTCVIDDDGRLIAREIMGCDLHVLLSPVTFGGYSPELKKAMDRNIPNLLPYFKMINGEVHHMPRYAKYPSKVSIGFLPAPDEDASRVFMRLCERNAINFFSPRHASGVFSARDSTAEIEAKIAGLLKQVEAIT